MEETPDRTGNSGMSELKVVFFFPLLPEEDIIKVVVDCCLFKRGGEAGKKGFQPMRKKLGEEFGVVFAFAVVVTDTGHPSIASEEESSTSKILGEGDLLVSEEGPSVRRSTLAFFPARALSFLSSSRFPLFEAEATDRVTGCLVKHLNQV